MSKISYKQARTLVADGDVAFFSHHNKIGDAVIKVWQWITHKKVDFNEGNTFSHVGIILTMGGRVFLLESSFYGGVRMVLLSSRQPDLIVQMGLTWNESAERVALQNLGKKYGLFESIKAGLGLRRKKDDKFICTEYVADICKELGYNFPNTKQLPSNFYTQLKQEGKPFIKIKNPKDSI